MSTNPREHSLVYIIPVADVRRVAVEAGLRETDVIGLSDRELLGVIRDGFAEFRGREASMKIVNGKP